MPDEGLEEFQKRREIVAIAATRWPRAWSEAAGYLLERSRTEIQADIRHGDKFKATDARIRRKALLRVDALLEVDEDKRAKLPDLSDDDERSFDHALVELQQVLCPRGWREKTLKFFVAKQKEAFDAFVEEGADEELYYYRELSNLIDRFEQVEQDGIGARARLDRELKEAS